MSTINKTVGVCCGTSTGNDPVDAAQAYLLGKELAADGPLVRFGGSGTGIMKSFYEGYQSGYVQGVSAGMEACISQTYIEDSRYFEGSAFCTVIPFSDEIERLNYITTSSDINILGPGGLGTISEGLGNIANQIASSYKSEASKHTIIFDLENLYSPLRMQFLVCVLRGYTKPEAMNMIHRATDYHQVMKLVGSLKPVKLNRISSLNNESRNDPGMDLARRELLKLAADILEKYSL